MKIASASATNLPKGANTDAQLIINADKDKWLDTVTAGQILKGRVLKAYGEHKYGVMFGGQERIVDSTIPLTVGDTLTGNVTSVNEKVVSMKVIETAKREELNNIATTNHKLSKTPLEASAISSGVDLTPLQQKIILSAANLTTNVALAINMGLYLVKLGIPITSELIQTLTSRAVLENDLNTGHHNEIKVPIIEYQDLLASDSEHKLSLNEAIGKLKQFFEHVDELDALLSEESTHATLVESKQDLLMVNGIAAFDKDDSSETEDRDLARLLDLILNVNTHGSIKHRLKSLPIVIDGRLQEFDVAFFDQEAGAKCDQKVVSKSLKFSLDTDYGKLDIVAKTVNDRISISFMSLSELFLDSLESNEQALLDQLISAGWKVNALNFSGDINSQNAVESIVNHVLQQDSLNIVA
jgi:hypothetical protein